MTQTRNQKVLIFEPHAVGHHGPYLQWMAIGLAERGFDVTVVTLPEIMTHPAIFELTNAANESAGSLKIVATKTHIKLPSVTTDSVDLIAREWAYWRLFRAWYKTHGNNVQPDVVFIPYLDYCLYAIGLRGSPFGDCPWVGLAMRPSFHYRSMGITAPRPSLGGIKKMLFFRVLRNRYLKKLLTIDEPLANYLADVRRFSGKAVFFPEPAEFGQMPAPDEVKQKFGMTPERKLILLYGAVTARKGVAELLRVLADTEFPKEVDVLLAGKVAEPSIRHMLTESWVRALCDQGRLRIIDRFIETAEEPALFAAADIVWMGYRGHYNASGLLVQAASTGRPILACKEGVIGWQTQRHNLGRTVNPADVAEATAAVNALLSEPPEKAPNNRRADVWRPPSFAVAQDALAQVLAGT